MYDQQISFAQVDISFKEMWVLATRSQLGHIARECKHCMTNGTWAKMPEPTLYLDAEKNFSYFPTVWGLTIDPQLEWVQKKLA